MKFLRPLLVALASYLLPMAANAASCFWVGGAGGGNYNNSALWASSSGGTGGTCAAVGGVPSNSADSATQDGSSGSGTLTLNIDLSINTLTLNASVGVFDATTHNVTLGAFNNTGTSTRTLHMGSGAWTITSTSGGTIFNQATTTGLTFDKGTATLAFTGVGTANFGALTYNGVTVNNPSNNGGSLVLGSGGATFASLAATPGSNFQFQNTSTTTLSAAPTWTGTSAAPITIDSNSTGASATIAVSSGTPSLTWTALRHITFTGSAGTATNSFNQGGVSGITVTAPSSGGGGGFIIGG